MNTSELRRFAKWGGSGQRRAARRLLRGNVRVVHKEGGPGGASGAMVGSDVSTEVPNDRRRDRLGRVKRVESNG